MKTYVKSVKLNSGRAIEAVLTDTEYSVLKLALKYYDNGYGLSVLKKLEKSEK